MFQTTNQPFFWRSFFCVHAKKRTQDLVLEKSSWMSLKGHGKQNMWSNQWICMNHFEYVWATKNVEGRFWISRFIYAGATTSKWVKDAGVTTWRRRNVVSDSRNLSGICSSFGAFTNLADHGWMEDILHQLKMVVYPSIDRVSTCFNHHFGGWCRSSSTTHRIFPKIYGSETRSLGLDRDSFSTTWCDKSAQLEDMWKTTFTMDLAKLVLSNQLEVNEDHHLKYGGT